ncbi:MAG: histidine phosphatase family protein [Phaeodactylibacter sp.]|nr:histidine phosphatase family protein [Phaeodactylibacter sp.]
MKTLYFIRHAKSSWEDSSLDDIERPLNKRGERDAPLMATRLQGLGVVPDQIVSSPATRALTTAHYFADALGIDPDTIHIDERIYLVEVRGLLQVIREWPAEWNTVLLFGHNPTITDFSNLHNQGRIDNVPTCGICKFEGVIPSWSDWSEHRVRLTKFMYPKEYLV